MLKKSLRLSLIVVVAVVALAATLVMSNRAFAHGSLLNPLSRIYLCYLENAESPDTMPCQDLVNMSGTQPIYDWTEVNIRDAGANSMSIIPDGKLCSAGREKYYGLDQARADWPVTTLPAGGTPYTFRWSVTANHQIATFHFYVTKDGYNPNNPLKWSDLENFANFDNPTLDTVAGLEYPVYQFTTNLPNKTGRHLIYVLWERHDSIEDFYSCSDVWFGSSAQPTATAAPACTSPAWVSGTSYATGANVSYNNKEWTARWSNSEQPSSIPMAAPWKLVANCTSGGGGGPTNTPAAATATKTNTPVGPTATLTRTPTRTNTPTGPTATFTRTATRTNTPSGPTATASRTATRTNTPVAPTATATSGGGTGTCSPVSATITAPFTKDGVGTFCWQSSNLGTYINSWNTASVTINGTNITNVYVASGSYPAKIGGFWYVTYNSTVAFGHFEAK